MQEFAKFEAKLKERESFWYLMQYQGSGREILIMIFSRERI